MKQLNHPILSRVLFYLAALAVFAIVGLIVVFAIWLVDAVINWIGSLQ